MTSMNRYLALSALSLLAACGAETDARPAGDAPPAPPAEASAGLVTVTAADFYFRSPASVPAGLTTIRLVNRGSEFHHVQLVRIDEGHDMEEFMDRVAAGEMVPEWVTLVGGPNTPVPGGTSEATLELEPGDYAMICIIPSKDGVPHLMKGMVVPLTVSGTAAPAAEPRADVRMVLADYSYDLSPEIGAGRRTIRVENAAAQPHEVFIVRLAPGKTLADVLEWFRHEEGPPPGMPVAGTTGLSRGEVNFLTADFEPGEYALLCMIPDARDGRPHIMHGMARQISVR